MTALETMVAEHRMIERVLDVLERDAANVEPVRLTDIVTFLRGYADALHHGKEEAILFAALRQQGCPAEFAPVLDAICRDHETGRNLVDDLAAIARKPMPWSDEVRSRLERTAHSFVSLLRRHIREEDDFVFPQAFEHLTAHWTKRVEKACDRFDKDHTARREKLEGLAEDLTSG